MHSDLDSEKGGCAEMIAAKRDGASHLTEHSLAKH
jgi:hypothetical protein